MLILLTMEGGALEYEVNFQIKNLHKFQSTYSCFTLNLPCPIVTAVENSMH